MADIVRIVIKGTSGYCCFDDAFSDKVTLTSESISYEYIPCMESEMNSKRKWSYKTNSLLFKMQYEQISSMISATIVLAALNLTSPIRIKQSSRRFTGLLVITLANCLQRLSLWCLQQNTCQWC